MSLKSIKNKLIDLGFSEHDAMVYIALLAKGPCTAGPLVAETNLHRNIVYTSLEHLVSRKLATEKIIRGTKNFAITSPDLLTLEYENKAKEAKNTVKLIKQNIPKDFRDITIHQGNDEYLNLLTSLIQAMPQGSTQYVLGTGGQEFMDNTMWPIWKKYHKAAGLQDLHIKMISYESQRQALKFDENSQKFYTIKYLPDNIENPGGMHIYPEINTVLNIIYSTDKTPVVAIKIVNKALVQSYLHLFKNLWQLGKK